MLHQVEDHTVCFIPQEEMVQSGALDPELLENILKS